MTVLSRAPWQEGQFERMVGLVRRALHKSVGQGQLTFSELKEVLLDVEVALNNRPLSYVEGDVQLPILTPNTLLYTQPNALPEMQPHHEDNLQLRRRAKYLQTREAASTPCGKYGPNNTCVAYESDITLQIKVLLPTCAKEMS